MRDFEFIPRLNWARDSGHITPAQYHNILIEVKFVWDCAGQRHGERRAQKCWDALNLEQEYNKK